MSQPANFDMLYLLLYGRFSPLPMISDLPGRRFDAISRWIRRRAGRAPMPCNKCPPAISRRFSRHRRRQACTGAPPHCRRLFTFFLCAQLRARRIALQRKSRYFFHDSLHGLLQIAIAANTPSCRLRISHTHALAHGHARRADSRARPG